MSNNERFGSFGGGMGVLPGIQGISQSVKSATYPSEAKLQQLIKKYPNIDLDMFINFNHIPFGAVGRNIHNNLMSNRSINSINKELQAVYNRLYKY